MIQVFHVFKKNALILKQDYTPEFRKSFFKWEDQMTSRLGLLQNEKLLLPNGYKELINVSRTGGIIIQDIIGYSGTSAKKEYLLGAKRMNLPEWYVKSYLKRFSEITSFNKEDRIRHFELFSLKADDSGGLELFSRENYKLCELTIGKPIEIKVNSKSDFTMTSGKQRTYYEHDYIVEYLGTVQTIEFVPESKLEIVRDIPWKVAKVIDLRKAFY